MFDYVIVGGGSAGCVLANRLSEDPSLRVCLLEAGPADRSPLVHTPVGALALVPRKHLNWAYNTLPQSGLNGRRGYQPRGKVLGGSSAINAMIYPKNRSYPIPSALFWRNPTVGGGAIPVNVRLRCSQIRSQTARELNCSVVVATQA